MGKCRDATTVWIAPRRHQERCEMTALLTEANLHTDPRHRLQKGSMRALPLPTRRREVECRKYAEGWPHSTVEQHRHCDSSTWVLKSRGNGEGLREHAHVMDQLPLPTNLYAAQNRFFIFGMLGELSAFLFVWLLNNIINRLIKTLFILLITKKPC